MNKIKKACDFLNWALFLFLIAASWTAAAMELMISTPTWSRSSLLKAPFQRFAILSWTWLGCTFQVFCLKLLLFFWVFILIHHKYSCSLAKWDPDVHFPLGRFEWPGHASPGAALFGLQGFLHLCKVSGLCSRIINMLSMHDVMSHNLGITLSCFHLHREPELWHSACVRVWGRNCTNFVPFRSWRDMFLRRPRVRFDGKQMFYLFIYWLCVRVYKTSTVPLHFSNPQKRLMQNLTNHVNAASVCSLLAEPE